MKPFDLLIWDCDGVLVDSEVISVQTEVKILASMGYPISERDYTDRFVGTTREASMKIIEEETGRSFAGLYDPEEYIRRVSIEFSKSLRAPEGTAEVLAQIDLPMCIASGSSVKRNTHALRVTGLLDYFEGKIFTSLDLPRGKPAPDIFLYAAKQMGAEPARCLVIEDSVHGIEAARAAGMTVFAFLGGSHVNEAWGQRLQAAGPDRLFNDMRALPGLLEGYKTNA